ncbi:dUTP diphosphatase [Bacillus amyloliquefaciens]|uniref:dUTP diphosphatase n=1 Tax=Bacillus velezensis TaxID=492670 RepID=UPI001ABE3597|nr:dUTP diphosphatase [Bacillus velezensis]MBO3789608.1 dUTP diphosphatase [Bacillus velezensis]
MNLQKMFEMQKLLDDRIIKEKGLEGQDLLPNLILALQVELAECANEWRGFKHWSNDQEPRTKHPLEVSPNGTFRKGGNPLLEEYVDCLHFLLSIGNKIGVKEYAPIKYFMLTNDITGLFNSIFKLIGQWDRLFLFIDHDPYHFVMYQFLQLGEALGFTRQEIETAYMEKNVVNHQRQQEGD